MGFTPLHGPAQDRALPRIIGNCCGLLVLRLLSLLSLGIQIGRSHGSSMSLSVSDYDFIFPIFLPRVSKGPLLEKPLDFFRTKNTIRDQPGLKRV